MGTTGLNCALIRFVREGGREGVYNRDQQHQRILTSLCLSCRFVQFLAQEDHLGLGHITVSRWTGELEKGEAVTEKWLTFFF